jgi:hypothetical protein
VSEALDECTIKISSLKYTTADQAQILGKKCRVPPCSYEKAVAKVYKKYNLERSEISMETALSRTKVGRKLKVNNRGTEPPMISIEAHLLAVILRRPALRQPVSCGEGIELANSMIEGMESQVAFMELKKNHLKNGPQDDTFGTLGQRYWQNFCRRNADVITSKNAVRFDSKRDDWCRLENFADMYDVVFEKLVQSGVAEKLDHFGWRDIENNIVNTEAEACGRQTGYSLVHPDKLVFFEEVGENILQSGDGNDGGHKFMVAKDMPAQVRNSFKDNHFTVLGFTSADGRPVMSAIIIAPSKLRLTGVTWFNPLSKDAKDVRSDEMKVLDEKIVAMKDENSNGVDRMFPLGSTCTFNGSQVPTFITCSNNDSIISQLLTKMLSKMDDLRYSTEVVQRTHSSYVMGTELD